MRNRFREPKTVPIPYETITQVAAKWLEELKLAKAGNNNGESNVQR